MEKGRGVSHVLVAGMVRQRYQEKVAQQKLLIHDMTHGLPHIPHTRPAPKSLLRSTKLKPSAHEGVKMKPKLLSFTIRVCALCGF